jgi:MFS family permease
MNQPNSKSIFTKAALLLASTLTVMAGATISPSLPAIRDQFAATAQVDLWVRLILTLPSLFIVIGSPIAGIVVDRLGRKPLLVVSAALYGLAGSSGFVLDSLPAILCGRAFLGLAVAGIMVSATTLIADYYAGPARAAFMGLQAAFMALGGVLFLSVGGQLADLNWRFPFLIYLFAWLLLPLLVVSLYEPRSTKNTLSIREGINQPPVPVKLLALAYGANILTQIAFYLIPVQLPFYLKSLMNAGGKESGLAIALCTLFSAFISLFYGKIKQHFKSVAILALTFALMGIGYTLIGLSSNYTGILTGLAIAGLGTGLLMPNLAVWVSAEVPDAMRGRALGGLSTSMFLGQFLSPIVTQPISQEVGLGMTYTSAGGVLLLLGLVFWVAKRQVMTLVGCSARSI